MKPLLSALVVLFSLASCAASPKPKPDAGNAPPRAPEKEMPCKTVCGLRADVPEASCVAMNAMEARALYYYEKEVPDFRPGPAACAALEGWTVKIHKRKDKDDEKCSPESFIQDLGAGRKATCVYGYTKTSGKFIELNDEAWAFNAFAHELGHVLDEAFGTEKGPFHCGWTARGLSTAILEASFTVDETDEKCPAAPKAP